MLLRLLLLSYVTLCISFENGQDGYSEEHSRQPDDVEDKVDNMRADDGHLGNAGDNIDYWEVTTEKDTKTKVEEVINELCESIKMKVDKEAQNLKDILENHMQCAVNAFDEKITYIKSYTDNVVKCNKDKSEDEIKKCSNLIESRIELLEGKLDTESPKIDAIALQLNKIYNDLKDLSVKPKVSKPDKTPDLNTIKDQCNISDIYILVNNLKEGQNALQSDISVAKNVSEDALRILNTVLFNATQLADVVQAVNEYTNRNTRVQENTTIGVVKDRCQIEWVADSNGKVPANAIPVDYSNSMYIGRAIHDGELTPGPIVPYQNALLVPYFGKAIPYSNYEVLTGCDVQWVQTSGNNILLNSIQGGYEKSGRVFHICRYVRNGQLVAGKVHMGFGRCYISQEGREHSVTKYQILLSK